MTCFWLATERGEFVWTTMPSRIGVWQVGTSLGIPSTSARQMRQEATIDRPGW